MSTLVLSVARPAASQTSTNQTLVDPRPSDARMNQFEEPKGSSWRVFAVESFADGPLDITEVQEVRQQNPPSSWAVFARNRSMMPVSSYKLAAAVVTGDGNVKAFQTLPPIKNLQPGRIARQSLRVMVAVLAPTDRVVFFVSEALSELGSWKTTDSEMTAVIRDAAKRLPVP
jgi:hypothetical protein